MKTQEDCLNIVPKNNLSHKRLSIQNNSDQNASKDRWQTPDRQFNKFWFPQRSNTDEIIKPKIKYAVDLF